ncbi:28554_t:CDS:2 [Dentiscutata erythropus]|uniref:28554_t:CDS:1 n=1 Tax=Dentiscutata erythropus TaxID=1348616 RepID=A0A9N9B9Y7_9GLOM|nr:28554_t:CDS:2 [Dentiscutata erythropus]
MTKNLYVTTKSLLWATREPTIKDKELTPNIKDKKLTAMTLTTITTASNVTTSAAIHDSNATKN